MKKLKIFTALVLLFLLSCKSGYDKEQPTKWKNLTDNRPDLAVEADKIGEEHNKELSEIHDKVEKGDQVDSDNIKTGDEIEKPEFSDEIQKYVDEIEKELDKIDNKSPKWKIRRTLKRVEQIENEARTKVKDEEELEPFYAYTATTRASLAYWYDNLNKWDSLKAEKAKENFNKIGAFVASDLVGAYHGWKMGIEIANEIISDLKITNLNQQKRIKKAVASVCCVTVGAMSSYEGWNTGEISVVIPTEERLEEIRKEKTEEFSSLKSD